MANKEEILEAIKEMSVLELSELVKELEDVFGVSAAAPVAVAAAPAGDDSSDGAKEEEKSEFNVVVTDSLIAVTKKRLKQLINSRTKTFKSTHYKPRYMEDFLND